MAKSNCILFFLFIFIAQINGQFSESFSTKKYHKDLDQFRALLEAHPEPNRHHSKEEFENQFDLAKTKINKGLTNAQFFKELATISAMIKDGHTSVYVPSDWLKKEQKEHGVLPFKFYLTNDDELFIIKAFVDEYKDLVGSKVEAINGMPFTNFINSIDPIISYEKKSFRNVIIQERMELFLYLEFGTLKDLTLTCFKIKSEDHSISLMEQKSYNKYIKLNRTVKETRMNQGKPYHYSKVDDNIGLLSVYSFSADNLDNYKGFLLNAFKEIKKDSIKHLLIDVRENLGGWPKISSLLFHYITESHFKTIAYSETKVSRAYNNYFEDRINKYGVVFISSNKKKHNIDVRSIVNEPIGTTLTESNFYNETPMTMENEYNGQVYLLTDRKSFSASSCFAATFRCYQMGAIIGEETGGTNIFYANAFSTNLFNSDIRFYVSTVKDFTTCFDASNPDSGIVPDIPFTPSIIDEMNDFDSQLNYSKMLINRAIKKAATPPK